MKIDVTSGTSVGSHIFGTEISYPTGNRRTQNLTQIAKEQIHFWQIENMEKSHMTLINKENVCRMI